jgi:hypothetical protein
LDNAICQVLFGDKYCNDDEFYSDEQCNLININAVFVSGLGKSHLVLNEYYIEEDLLASKSLNEYCIRDFDF